MVINSHAVYAQQAILILTPENAHVMGRATQPELGQMPVSNQSESVLMGTDSGLESPHISGRISDGLYRAAGAKKSDV